MAGLAVNTISDAYPGAAPTAVGLAVFFVAAVPLELRRRCDAQGADAGLRGHRGMSALARGVAPERGPTRVRSFTCRGAIQHAMNSS